MRRPSQSQPPTYAEPTVQSSDSFAVHHSTIPDLTWEECETMNRVTAERTRAAMLQRYILVKSLLKSSQEQRENQSPRHELLVERKKLAHLLHSMYYARLV